jgi:hypothetical protein
MNNLGLSFTSLAGARLQRVTPPFFFNQLNPYKLHFKITVFGLDRNIKKERVANALQQPRANAR